MATVQAASSARQAARAALHKARPSPTAAVAKPVKKQEKLAKTLEWLNKEPKPILERIHSLELTYAYRNDHFGARYVRASTPRKVERVLVGPAIAVLRTRHVSLAILVYGCAFVSHMNISLYPDILQKRSSRASRTTTLP